MGSVGALGVWHKCIDQLTGVFYRAQNELLIFYDTHCPGNKTAPVPPLRRQLQQALASGFIPDAPGACMCTDFSRRHFELARNALPGVCLGRSGVGGAPGARPLAEDSLPLPLKKRNWGTRHDKANIPQ